MWPAGQQSLLSRAESAGRVYRDPLPYCPDKRLPLAEMARSRFLFARPVEPLTPERPPFGEAWADLIARAIADVAEEPGPTTATRLYQTALKVPWVDALTPLLEPKIAAGALARSSALSFLVEVWLEHAPETNAVKFALWLGQRLLSPPPLGLVSRLAHVLWLVGPAQEACRVLAARYPARADILMSVIRSRPYPETSLEAMTLLGTAPTEEDRRYLLEVAYDHDERDREYEMLPQSDYAFAAAVAGRLLDLLKRDRLSDTELGHALRIVPGLLEDEDNAAEYMYAAQAVDHLLGHAEGRADVAAFKEGLGDLALCLSRPIPGVLGRSGDG